MTLRLRFPTYDAFCCHSFLARFECNVSVMSVCVQLKWKFSSIFFENVELQQAVTRSGNQTSNAFGNESFTLPALYTRSVAKNLIPRFFHQHVSLHAPRGSNQPNEIPRDSPMLLNYCSVCKHRGEKRPLVNHKSGGYRGSFGPSVDADMQNNELEMRKSERAKESLFGFKMCVLRCFSELCWSP